MNLGKVFARKLYDIFFQMKMEGATTKKRKAYGWDRHLEILGSGPLNHKMVGKRRPQGLHIVCTHKPRGKSWDRVELHRRGKR